MRPMGGDSAAMADLRRILATREGLYQEADLVFDSSGRSVAESAKLLARKVVSETSGERPPSRIRRAKTAAVRKRPRQKVGSPG
jgi:XRE family aerobic/anaerobic benzoate catabolism transcriptional regulator